MKKIIHFIDIDDTLFFPNAKIGVMKNGVRVKKLSPQEFNNYILGSDEEFNFDEFRCAKTFTTTSRPNLRMIKKVKQLRKKGEEVAFLTARADFDNKEMVLDYMRENGLNVGHYKENQIHIIRCGNEEGTSTALKKKDLIQRIMIKRPEIEAFTLYDDSIQNLKEVASINMKNKTFLVDEETVTQVKFKG